MDQEAAVQRAMALAREGSENEAREILKLVLRQNRDNLAAWQGMARLAGNRTDLLFSIRQILRLKPDDEWALSRLARMDSEPASAPEPARRSFGQRPAPPPAEEDPIDRLREILPPLEPPPAPAEPAPVDLDDEAEPRLGAWLEDLQAPPERVAPRQPVPPRPTLKPAAAARTEQAAPAAAQPAVVLKVRRKTNWIYVIAGSILLGLAMVIGLVIWSNLIGQQASSGEGEETLPAIQEATIAPLATLQAGSTARRTLEQRGEVHDWLLEAEAGQNLAIFVNPAAEADPELFLLDAAYQQLGYDDDDGEGLGARLDITVSQTGSYILRVRAKAPGTYVLIIAEQ
jgi:hypothetical protein